MENSHLKFRIHFLIDKLLMCAQWMPLLMDARSTQPSALHGQ